MNISQPTRHFFLSAAFIALTSLVGSFGLGLGAAATAQAAVLPDFTDLVDKVGPAVVKHPHHRRSKQMQQGGSSEDEEMQEFVRRFFGQLRRASRSPHRVTGVRHPSKKTSKCHVGSALVSSSQPMAMC